MEEKTMTGSHSGSTLSRTVFKTMGLFGGIQVFSILLSHIHIGRGRR
ncbi:MAG: hypothetical protein K2L29_07025 [Duncaniella sp.]|nr:hypothetical protein [Duncaniella sp.]